MNFEKYTDRARGFVQSAQSLALREGHQQFAPEHLLKVLLDDPEGLAVPAVGARRGGRADICGASLPAATDRRASGGLVRRGRRCGPTNRSGNKKAR